VLAALFARSAMLLASVELSREKLASDVPALAVLPVDPVLPEPKLDGELALPVEPVLPLPKVSFALRSISISAV
jgi:hypothetical protein